MPGNCSIGVVEIITSLPSSLTPIVVYGVLGLVSSISTIGCSSSARGTRSISRNVLISPRCLLPTSPSSIALNISLDLSNPERLNAWPRDLKNCVIFSNIVSAFFGIAGWENLLRYSSAIASST